MPLSSERRKTRTYSCAVIIGADEALWSGDEFPPFGSIFPLKAHLAGPATSEFTFIDSNEREHYGVAAFVPAMDRTACHQTTAEILDKYKPTLAVTIGVGRSLSNDLKPGDIVVASQVDDIANRKKVVDQQTGQGPQILLGPILYDTSLPIITDIEDLRISARGRYATWQRECTERFEAAVKNPGPGDVESCPEIHIGKLACDAIFDPAADWLNRGQQPPICFDAEAVGFLRACQDHMIPFTLILKAIDEEISEKSDRGRQQFWQNYAMSNACTLLAVVLKTLSFATARNGIHVTKEAPPEDALLELARQRFFKKHHVKTPERFPELRAAYSRLFSHFLTGDMSDIAEDVFDGVAAALDANTDDEPIHLLGEPGTGKTTFLSFLYLAFYHRFKQRPLEAPIPVFINLKEYLYPAAALTRPSLWDPSIQWQQDAALIGDALQDCRARSVVFLIDGVDEYSPVLERLERDVIGLVDSCGMPKKILVGLGKNYLGDNPFFKRDFPYLRPPRIHLRLRAVRLNSPAAHAVASSFAALPPNGGHRAGAEELMKQASQFRFASLDLQTLSMLYDSLHDPRYSECGSVTDFLSVLCRSVLYKHRSDAQETIDSAAKLAFMYALNPLAVDLVTATKQRAWKLIHIHPAVNDFLIAYYTIMRLKQAATARDEGDLRDLDFVFPYRVNRFCKELANASVDDQLRLLEGAKKVYTLGRPSSKPHGCYVIGRLADPSVQRGSQVAVRM